MKSLFYKKSIHKLWDERLEALRPQFEVNAKAIDRDGMFPHENIQLLRDNGFTSLTLPEKYGGAGFSLYDTVLVQEKLGSLDGSTALILNWTLMTVGELYEYRYWDEEQLKSFAAKIVGGAITNRAVSEFAMGSPTRGGQMATNAVFDGGQWIINGRKNYTTGSYGLDYILTAAWLEKQQQVGYFLIPQQVEGVSIEENWDVLSMRGTGSHDLVLNNVKLSPDSLVEVGPVRAQTLNGWMLLIPATYLGIAQAARDYAISFAKTHAPNSIEGTISQLPNVQALLGEIELELARARFTIYGVAEAYDDVNRRAQLTEEIGLVKHVVTNTALSIVDKAMRIVGAKSLQMSCPLQRYYRDVRAGLHNPPMDDMTIQKLAIQALQENTEN